MRLTPSCALIFSKNYCGTNFQGAKSRQIVNREYRINTVFIVAVAIGLQMLSSATNAQTYFKCVQPSGKVEFSNMGCDAKSEGTMLRQRSNSLDSSGARQQYQLDAQRQEIEQNHFERQQRATAAAAAVQSVCPSDRDISNLETKASSITLTDKDRKFLQSEIRRARACKKEGGRYDAEDWKQINEAQSSVNRIDAKDRETGRAKAEGIHSVSASDREQARMIAEKEIEARERAARAATPSTITSCDPGGCWDNLGGRYSRSAGDNFFRNDGKSCQSIGGMMRCN